MLTLERQNEIYELIKKKKSVSIDELAKRFYISPASIRRDLVKLEQNGLIKRTYGGAILIDGFNAETPLLIREAEQIGEKERIAQHACEMVRDRDTVFMDSSSTTRFMAKYLNPKMNITIITNGIRLMTDLSEQQNVTVYGIGGKLRHHSLSMIGSQAETSLSNFWASTLFFSCTALSIQHGAMDSSDGEAEVRKKMMSLCRTKVLLCDHTKFDRTAFYRICGFEDIDAIITDEQPSAQWQQYFTQHSVHLLVI